jgi:hypothetical protein
MGMKITSVRLFWSSTGLFFTCYSLQVTSSLVVMTLMTFYFAKTKRKRKRKTVPGYRVNRTKLIYKYSACMKNSSDFRSPTKLISNMAIVT